METFVKKKGWSHLLTKKTSECTDEEKAYKRLYSAYIKQRYITKQNKDEFVLKTQNYNKEYYQKNKEKLKLKQKERYEKN
jgi:hypothetical protein